MTNISAQEYNVIGIMSGTSLDGVDLAFCRFVYSTNKWVFEIMCAETISYSPSWKQALLNNEVIYPFSDMFISPVPLSFAVKILSLVIAKRLPGILQVSGDRDISYYEAARLGAQLLGANEYLLQPTPSPHLTSYCDGMLTHTTLNISRLKSELGLEPPDVFWTLKSIFINPQAL